MRRATTSASASSSACRRPPPRSESVAGRPASWRAQMNLADGKLPDVDMRNPRRSAAARRLAQGCPLHVDARRLRLLDRDAPLEERPRRPADRDALGREPYPPAVDELEPLEREVRRERAAEPGQFHGPARQFERDPLDHRAAALGCCRPRRAPRRAARREPASEPAAHAEILSARRISTPDRVRCRSETARVGIVALERHGHVQANRADRRVVAHAASDADEQIGRIQRRLIAHLAAVDEECGAEILAEALPVLEAPGADRRGADRIVGAGKIRTHRLVGIAADAAAAAAVEALIRRGRLQTRLGALGDARKGARGQHAASGFAWASR